MRVGTIRQGANGRRPENTTGLSAFIPTHPRRNTTQHPNRGLAAPGPPTRYLAVLASLRSSGPRASDFVGCPPRCALLIAGSHSLAVLRDLVSLLPGSVVATDEKPLTLNVRARGPEKSAFWPQREDAAIVKASKCRDTTHVLVDRCRVLEARRVRNCLVDAPRRRLLRLPRWPKERLDQARAAQDP
jgi:hypothetical protein